MRRCGGTGIHTGFKLQCRIRIKGSTPFTCTKYFKFQGGKDMIRDARYYENRIALLSERHGVPNERIINKLKRRLRKLNG